MSAAPWWVVSTVPPYGPRACLVTMNPVTLVSSAPQSAHVPRMKTVQAVRAVQAAQQGPTPRARSLEVPQPSAALAKPVGHVTSHGERRKQVHMLLVEWERYL